MWISRKKWKNLGKRVAGLEKQLHDQKSVKKFSIRLDCIGKLTNAEANDIIHGQVEKFKKVLEHEHGQIEETGTSRKTYIVTEVVRCEKCQK